MLNFGWRDPLIGRSERGKTKREGGEDGLFLRVKDGKTLPGGTLVGFLPGNFHKVRPEMNLEHESVLRRPNNYYFVINEPMPKPNFLNECIAVYLGNLKKDQ